MTRTLIAAAVIALVTGCNNPAPSVGTPAVTTAPDTNEMPLEFETEPLAVDSGSVTEQDPTRLAGAAWTAKQCVLSVPGDASELLAANGAPTRLQGFFIAPDDQPAGKFDIVLKGETENYHVPASTGWERTDVADFFKMPQLASSGFDVGADLSNVPAGRYKVDFLMDRDGAQYFCESGKYLLVAASTANGDRSPTEDGV